MLMRTAMMIMVMMTTLLTKVCVGAEIQISLNGISPDDSVSKVEVLTIYPVAQNGYKFQESWTVISNSNWRVTRDSTNSKTLYLPIAVLQNSSGEKIRISTSGSAKPCELSLAGRAPYTATFESIKPKHAAPAYADLCQRGVDPLLATCGNYDGKNYLVPGYKAMRVERVVGETLVFPIDARFQPMLLVCDTKGWPDGLIKHVMINFGNAKIKRPANTGLAVPQVMCDLAKQGADVKQILATGISVSPDLPTSYQPLFQETVQTISPERLKHEAEISVTIKLQQAKLRLRTAESADPDWALMRPTFRFDSGQPAGFIESESKSTQDGWEITPALSQLHVAPQRLLIEFGAAFASQTIELDSAAWRGGVEIKSPSPKGWIISSPIPAGTLFRISLPHAADVWVAEFNSHTNVLQLPRGKLWDDLKGATIEVRSPNSVPVYLTSGKGNVLSLSKTVYRTTHAKETFVVLNNVASVVAASSSSENRIRQLQSEVVRKLVTAMKDHNLNYRATMRVKEGLGNWSASPSDVLIMQNGELPFAQIGTSEDSGLARTVRRMAESAPSSDLHIVVVTPICAEERVTPDTLWIKTSLGHLVGRLTVHTVVVDARVRVNQKTLENFVNPIHARASSEINLFEESDRIVKLICEDAGIGAVK